MPPSSEEPGSLEVERHSHRVRSPRNALFRAISRVVAGTVPVKNLGMQRFQSFKFRLTATTDQQLEMRRIAGCCRFVFNRALALQNQRLDEGRKLMGSEELTLLLAEWRRHPDSLWLADAPFGTQRQSLRNLVQAFVRHSSQLTQPPRFKKRGRSDSFRCAVLKDIQLDQKNSRIHLPNLGWVRYRNSRAVMGSIRTVTVSASGASAGTRRR